MPAERGEQRETQSRNWTLLTRSWHKRTFSEDDRIQAQEKVKKTEDDDAGEISEPEDPLMLQRDPKDWKVRNI